MMRDALERRYDGPIPPPDPARPPVTATARARLFDRLAAEARGEAARRRARLGPQGALADGPLERLAQSLAAYRRHGLAWSASSPK